MTQKTHQALTTLENMLPQFEIPSKTLYEVKNSGDSLFEFLNIQPTETESDFELFGSLNKNAASNISENNTNESSCNLIDSTYTTIELSPNMDTTLEPNFYSHWESSLIKPSSPLIHDDQMFLRKEDDTIGTIDYTSYNISNPLICNDVVSTISMMY